MIGRSLASFLALCAALSVPVMAEAQYVVPGPPIYGSFSITLGDYTPGVMRGVAGGPIALGDVDSACRGTASVQPSHVILASGALPRIRIEVSSGADSTLMVLLPDGRRLCNDDSVGLNAAIETGTIAGPVYVWVGSYNGSTFPYSLTVTQSGGAPPPPPPMAPRIGAGGIPLDCGMSRAMYGSLRVGDGLILGAHTPYSGPNGQGGYANGDANWSTDMGRWVGLATVITSFEGVDDSGCPVVRVAADGGQYFWRVRDARPGYGAPPPPPPVVVAPPPVVVAPIAPPSSLAVRVTLTPRTPVTLFAPGITTPTVAVWSPRGGQDVEFGTVQRGGMLAISASIGGVATQLVEVPAALAATAVITATRRADGQVLFRAERAPDGADPGQQALFLVNWDRASSAPAIAQRWLGSFSDRAPGWAR